MEFATRSTDAQLIPESLAGRKAALSRFLAEGQPERGLLIGIQPPLGQNGE